MARSIKSWWDERSKRYYCRLGEVLPSTGRRGNFLLRDEEGRPVGFGDIRERDAAIQRRQAELAAADKLRRGASVREVCQAFLDWHRANGSAARTIQGHKDQLTYFCRFEADGIRYADRPAGSIDVPDLARMRRAMEAAGNQTGYVRIRYASVLACWRWAARPVEGREPLRILASNPFDGLARPRRGRGKNRALPWPVTRRMIRLGWGAAKRRDYHRQNDRDSERIKLLRTLYCALAGCRPDEAARLRWAEINFDRRVAVQEGKTTSRTGKMRRTPLTMSMAKALRRLSRWEGRHPEYVFLTARTRKTTPPNSHECAEWFREFRERMRSGPMPELPEAVTLYWLRHEFQSFGLEVASVEGVAAAAGNSPGVLLSTYEHTTDKRIVEVGDSIDRGRRTKLRDPGGRFS